MSLSDKTQSTARTVALRGIFLCLALVFSYLEAQLPLAFLPIPGVRLGFANLIVTYVAYTDSPTAAGIISFARVLVVALLFGSWTAFWFSLLGALFSFGILTLLLSFAKYRISPLGVSAVCAVFHNLGQICAAALYFTSSAVFAYLPALILSGIVMGSITGIIVVFLLRAIPRPLTMIIDGRNA